MNPTDPQDVAAFSQGVSTANVAPDGDAQKQIRDEADVARWFKDIKAARKHDEEARKGYARCRRYARGDRGAFEVTVPIAQSYIDVLHSIVFAKQPDVDVIPTGLTEPPPQKEIESMVLAQQGAGQMSPNPMQPPQGPAPAQTAGPVRALLSRVMPHMFPPPDAGAGSTPPEAMGAGSPPLGMPNLPAPGLPGSGQLAPDQTLQEQVTAILAPYQKKRDDAKQMADTLEIVIATQWQKALLKSKAKMMVKSALTVGPGWIKAMWLEREGKDPTVSANIEDVREQLARIAATKADINAGFNPDDDLLKATLEQQMQGLESKVDVLIAKGFAIDFVAAEDMQVSLDVPTLSQYCDASWLAQRAFKTREQCKADYPGVKPEDMSHATVYHPFKPKDTSHGSAGYNDHDITPEEADQYRASSNSTGPADAQTNAMQSQGNAGGGTDDDFLCVWEVWNRDAGMVLTIMEGVKGYIKEPMAPSPSSTRGHPFFLLSIGNIDGQRHPRSMVDRSARLFDEYDRVRTAFAKHRRRAIPKTAFDRTQYDETEIARLEGATIGEMVGLKMLRPGEPVSNALHVIQYPPVDPALYDTAPIRAELEMIWGVQEALSSSIHTAKTATESEIQQQGTNSRTGYIMDDLDYLMEDLAKYTAEISIQVLNSEDVEEIAGPWTLWPEAMSLDDMQALVTITIHAGSSGKPDTSAQRQAWAQIMPILQGTIKEIGQMRGSSSEEVADCLESLVIETVNRTGDRVDVRNFLPDPPRTPPPPPPPPPSPPMPDSALMGPQIAALEQVGISVRGGALSPVGAVALLQISCPHVPIEMIEAFVNGCKPLQGDPPTQLNSGHVETVTPQTPPGTLPNPAAAAANAGATP